MGTLANIEIVRADAEIALREQTLLVAQTRLLQQETILKTALSKTGVSSPIVAAAHIIPTDQIRVPDVDPISPIQDMTAMAISSRPELSQSRIQLQNQELTIRGSKNALLPTLDVVANLSNSALAGQINPLPALPGTVHSNTGFFIGGYSTVLSQLFARNFPNYSIGVNLSVPLRNRAAQAQVLSDQHLPAAATGASASGKSGSGGRAECRHRRFASRAQFQAAQKSQTLQQQTLDAEQKKLSVGASTPTT